MSLPDVALDVESILSLDTIDDPQSLEWPKRFIARELGWIPTFDLERTDAHGLYGGQVIAQTVWAACQTVSDGFDVHSTHGYFLRPGNSQERIVYNVFEVRTGRNYATRRVEAVQFDKVIYTSFANFKRDFAAQLASEDPSIRHGLPYPTDTWYPKYSDITKLPRNPDVDLPALHEFKSYWKMPINYRKFPMDKINARKERVHERRQLHFFRSRYEVSNKTHNFQAVVLMYSSDRNFLFTATNAHLATDELTFGHVASLDHSMIIHQSLGTPSSPGTTASALFHAHRTARPRQIKSKDRSEEWITYDTQALAAGNSRCLVTGYMWDKRGRHLATVMQEALADVNVVGPRQEPAAAATRGKSAAFSKESRLKTKYASKL
ncbi:Putative uncharacterized protein [Taphrina deformans PYCC 5710]|uniref:Acyl-CoA thioesterase II n=1 Tax=Taphrina deformans (strain PYCC 5710 / ATCC 11124 / CBS 356.35 / IMI 108563 / JCM 9778 / NBRC 8474) TaxID=1097556 RepID=R4XGK9_TAPDE|nr:Putative uncharacterized protein [Taphrina deformans PYCC 5710]|eukprot:CCG82504.1 Putative uncharacterized protein [Taphrina deformans PYCC 5710]